MCRAHPLPSAIEGGLSMRAQQADSSSAEEEDQEEEEEEEVTIVACTASPLCTTIFMIVT
jgi:hypothetical protein